MATTNYDYPTDTPLVDENGFITAPWGQFFQRVINASRSVQQSGVTGDRPTSVLWVGRTYFDTTINKPIWIKQVRPAVIWIDASGAVV